MERKNANVTIAVTVIARVFRKLVSVNGIDMSCELAISRVNVPMRDTNPAAIVSSKRIPGMASNQKRVVIARKKNRKYAPKCRFYSAGSSEEMGDVLYSPQDLNHPIRPRSPYGAAKAAARHITKVYRESYNLFAIHSILYNHESERRGEEFVTRKISKGVAKICKSIKDNTPFNPIELGNLNSKRDWSHAQDFVEGIS